MQKLIDGLRQGRSLLVLALLMALGGGTAMAAATFGPITGPTWLNPGYRWTVRVLTISNPDKQVCLDYTVTPPGTTTRLACTCDSSQYGNCAVGTGDWTCVIPTNHPNASIAWELGTFSSGAGGTCGDLKTTAGTGTFSTGPLAVDLSSFQGKALGAGGAAALAAGLALVLAYFRLRRSPVSV